MLNSLPLHIREPKLIARDYPASRNRLESAPMYELIFTVCSVLVGASCRQENPIQLEEHVGMMGCLVASQIEGAKWVEAHPNFYVTRYTCQPAKMFAHT
jgi:hypothetical protein